ncbi:MAG: minichromosome maintenance protein MCM [Candidatus Anstonellaceae archaeon]
MEKETLDSTNLERIWEEFANQFYKNDLADLELEYPTKKSLVVNFQDIQKFNPQLADFLLENPDDAISSFEKAIKKSSAGRMDIEFAPHVRIAGIPDNDLMIQNISSKHIDKIITVKGIITKRAEVMHKVKVAFYRCLLCEHVLKIPLTKKSSPPEICPECKKKALQLEEENSYFVDIQRAECQELLERIRGGAPASKIEIYLEDDNVNKLMPGESVELTGIVRLKPPLKTKGAKNQASGAYSRYLEINYINPINKDFEEIKITPEEEKKILEMAKDKNIYQKLQYALAPGIYGHDEVKLAIALQMFGGTKGKTMPGGVPIRDDIHILLIGDPGSAKSRMLQYAKELVPKGIYVSGKSATGAGLTATAEKDELSEGGWTLKAGALVLANGGLACIDEFDKMTEDERSAMHEAMEMQTISVAKAGIVATFRTKCAILAAANPKYGRFDPNRLPAEQFNLTPTILSRFDFIFAIYDVMDKVRDSEMAETILSAHRQKHEENKDEVDKELVRKYIAYMRKNIFPKLSQEASERIKEYYVELRERGKAQGAVPITPRQIEGIIRITEASAKARGSSIAEIEDAERAINLLNFMHDQILRDRQTGAIDIDILATGKPQSERRKLDIVWGIIKEFAEKFDTVNIADVIAEAKNNQIDETETERMLDEFLRKGEIYKVGPGQIKPVKNE